MTRIPHFGVGLADGFPIRTVGSLAADVEAKGFDDLWIPDERFERDVFVMLSVAAQRTRRLMLSTCVTDPYIRHPMLTAVAIATLDELTGGRARVALGAGLSGFTALGIERRRPATAIREAIAIMRRAWEGAPVWFDGELLACRGAQLAFPARSDIPVYVAGRGPAVLRAAGELADGVIIGTFSSERTIAAALAQVDRGLARSERTRAALDVTSWLYVAISDDAEQARLAVRRPVAVAVWGSRPILHEIGVRIPRRLEELMDRASYSLSGPALEEAASLVPLELTEDLAVAGTATEVTARLRRILGAGVNGIAGWLHPVPGATYAETLSAFADISAALRLAPGSAAGGPGPPRPPG
jgi:5,10-methylenetetrahydromethanopterin reductase